MAADRIASPFEGKLVRLRSFEPSDFSTLNAVFSDPAVLEGLGSMMPQPVAGFREWHERSAKADDEEAFAIETLADRTPIGGTSLFDIERPIRSALMGIWLGKAYWNQGYGTDAVRVLCRYAFRFMNLHRVELLVFASNHRAARAYEKVGFQVEGTLRDARFNDGHYEDGLVMGLLDDELRD